MDWFSTWFDTPYYHKLYNNRDFKEAEKFMSKLLAELKLRTGSSILDLACGKGRHSVYINKQGFVVKGVDLSPKSITLANNLSNKTLSFDVGDMRDNLPNKYDAVLNLFTSFGYFDDDLDDIKVLETIKNSMNKDGVAVIDFLNSEKIISNLVKEETVIKENIEFKIERKVTKGFIEKNICFNDDGDSYNYTERVKAIDLDKFNTYFDKVGLKLSTVFGNYNLNEYDNSKSDRLIMILTK